MTTEEDASREESPRGGGSGYRALTVINYVIGALGCAVLAFAIWLPESIGGKWGWAQRERNWQIAAAVFLVVAIIVVLRRRNYALLVLFLSCAFFIASCFDNFHWQGG